MSNYNQLNEENSQNLAAASQNQNISNAEPIAGEIELESIQKKVNPRDYLPDPIIQKKKAALSLQEQKKQLEQKNKKEIEYAILKRIIFRIFIFFVYLAILILGFIGIHRYLAYIQSSYTISMPGSLLIKMDTCQLTFYDDSSLGDNMKISFNIPGHFDFWLGDTSFLNVLTETDDESGYLNYEFLMKNVLTIESCEISVYVGTGQLYNLEVECLGEANCVIVSYSHNLTITNGTWVTGSEVYLNMLTLNTTSFDFYALKGLVQLNHFNVTNSSINLTTGNIILQSTDSYMLNWTSGNPSYCFSAPTVSQDDITGCETGIGKTLFFIKFFKFISIYMDSW